MKIKVVIPEKEIFNGEAKSINIPTESGRVTILPNHIELISVIVPGRIEIEGEDKNKKFLSEGGVLEVFKNEVNLLLRGYKEK